MVEYLKCLLKKQTKKLEHYLQLLIFLKYTQISPLHFPLATVKFLTALSNSSFLASVLSLKTKPSCDSGCVIMNQDKSQVKGELRWLQMNSFRKYCFFYNIIGNFEHMSVIGQSAKHLSKKKKKKHHVLPSFLVILSCLCLFSFTALFVFIHFTPIPALHIIQLPCIIFPRAQRK